MSDSERTHQIKAMIRKHLQEVGASRWKAVRAQLPDISDATFWRYVKSVREETAETPHTAMYTNRVADPSRNQVPALGSFPEYYTPLDKARLYEGLLADAETMKAQAVDHRGKITNWRMFDKSIQVRERLVREQSEAIALYQSQVDVERFFGQIVEIVLEEVPDEARAKVIERLKAVQQQGVDQAPQTVTSRAG